MYNLYHMIGSAPCVVNSSTNQSEAVHQSIFATKPKANKELLLSTAHAAEEACRSRWKLWVHNRHPRCIGKHHRPEIGFLLLSKHRFLGWYMILFREVWMFDFFSSDIDVVSYPFLLPDIPWRFPGGNLRLEDFQKTYSIYLNAPELQVWKNLFLLNFDFCCRD